MHIDDSTRARLLEAVRAAEARSDLEIVCRVVPRCDPYTDAALMAGAACGLVVLGVALFSAFVVSPLWVIPGVVAVGSLVAFCVGRWPSALRALAGRRRMAARALERAQAELHREAVTGTRRRTGVLVMAAVLEDQVVTLLDLPLEGRAPRAEWAAASHRGRGPGDVFTRMIAVVEALGTVGQTHVPALADNPNELDDDVRVG
jgi:putative membrane protein